MVASLSPQHIQESVPAWLSTQLKYDSQYRLPTQSVHVQDVDLTGQTSHWGSYVRRCKEELDIKSIVSTDDDVSVTGSTQESQSSESSSQTSWTSVTESSDTFFDEDGKEQLPPVTKVNSYTTVESQDQVLKGIQSCDVSTPANICTPCPISDSYRRLTGGVSKFLRQACSTQSQQPPKVCSRSWSGDSTYEHLGQHFRSRRSACSSGRPSPPKLRRDTDCTEQFVALLIVFAKRLITAIWPLSDCPPMSTECFGAGVLPLETFIRETLRRSKTSFSTLQVALYYLVLLKSRIPQGQLGSKCRSDSSEKVQCRAMQCGRRMFLSALMLASKYLQDRNYSARAWSKISGLRSNEINENEREYLAQINYDLHVPKETFENWSKLVMMLSRLSNERPSFRPGPYDTSSGSPGASSTPSLAAMVSQVDLDKALDCDQPAFTGSWWSNIIRKLEPGMVKDASLVDAFLRSSLPTDKLHLLASLQHLSKDASRPENPSSSSAIPHGSDLNFGDLSNTRNLPSTGLQRAKTPQTLVQMSPANSSTLPDRPQLANLPTPQSTPRINDQSSGEKACFRMPLRCPVSLEHMQSLRKQCFKNANLERCPPPQPQTPALPHLKSLIRSAETIQDLPTRSITPLTSSPASVSSDSTTLTKSTSRSRSSSISSVSSWSSFAPTMPHLRPSMASGLSSPLSRICSLSDRSHKPAAAQCHTSNSDSQDDLSSVSTGGRSPMSIFGDESSMEPSKPQCSKIPPTSSEVAAIHGLLSLSTLSEPSSQSVTPTPQRLSENGMAELGPHSQRQNDHKRRFSKTEPSIQTQVRDLVWDGSWPGNVVEDPLLPYCGTMHRQTQIPGSLRKELRRPVSTPMNHKRLCSLQHSSSTPTQLPLSDRLENSILLCG